MNSPVQVEDFRYVFVPESPADPAYIPGTRPFTIYYRIGGRARACCGRISDELLTDTAIDVQSLFLLMAQDDAAMEGE